MTIVIDLDQETQQSLASQAISAGMTIEEFTASFLKNSFKDSYSTNHQEPNLGFAAGRGIWISEDFDAPLDEFKDYI